ncbi:MAG: sugar ABC transporter ATP-binding protein [Christensenella sp.]|uniref:sugar ABC transporter ATP-binding protein n=1 Tax=Christensenella sp. TaxID=1935934 RepID=UPI002B214D47|nr:sugar ABC transporter ATP-binding protein [Christensenella sp.]MEA5003144.1 sugar ABC transporter ATP-binding protein [Christensenella sp.]
MQDNILEMKGITKLYPGVVALEDVNFTLKKGEVHALIGENGAGKSTLIKILAGAVKRDGGQVIFNGQEYKNYTPHEAMDMGISVIYQEFNLVPMMSIEENLFFGKEIKKGIFSDKAEMVKRAKEIFKQLSMDVDPATPVKDLTVAYQQLTEIAKAILNKAKIIVMDEPSATLTNRELKALFELIRRLKAEGTAIIYISHRLEEIFEIADTVTVFRDGQYIDTKPVSEMNKEMLIRMMVGRELTGTYPCNHTVYDDVVMEVKDLYNEHVKGASFSLKKGEILGITGLVGAGRTELVRMIFGADNYLGDIYVKGKKAKIKSPTDAIRYGISLLPEDRKSQGLLLNMGIDFNLSMIVLKSLTKNGFISSDEEQKIVEEYIRMISIKTPSGKQLVRNLSGGNQQKVVLAKWMATKSDIIIIDEPTRGIDVGAKSEIYELMDRLAGQGKSIIMISSGLPELIGMSDRAIVMHEGEIVGEVSRKELNQEKLLTMASSKKGELA